MPGVTVERCVRELQPGGRALTVRRADAGSVRLTGRDITSGVYSATFLGLASAPTTVALTVAPLAHWKPSALTDLRCEHYRYIVDLARQ